MTSQESREPWTFVSKPTMNKPMSKQEQEIAIKRLQEQLKLFEASDPNMSADTESKAELPDDDAYPTLQESKQPSHADAEPKDKDSECTCHAHPTPKLERNDTITFLDSDDDEYIRPRPRRRAGGRRYSISPIRRNTIPIVEQVNATTSTIFFGLVNKYDGVVDMPFPARSSVYLTTFPFTDRDVRKYEWLFKNGVDDAWLWDKGREERRGRREEDDEFAYDDYTYPHAVYGSRRRARSPYYADSMIANDIPSVYFSKALDTSIVPEETEKLGGKEVKYWFVVQNRNRNPGIKLMVADSRKAAGIMMYYEALSGHSIAFVGAVVGVEMGRKLMKEKKFKRVESLDEAVKVQDEQGVVAIIC
ncbi:hypothetical protein K491DRAFT_686203 [Lophiostoma macrostomum CBS 122681]|uniref:Uncharacterized protein n=1 Tax=Lophiostoma macrostomum CBS 122681 TaxID=1314788 RepID=A0A6A6TVM9_9PLEO|nr:hypothetical protein K491DRAFT_686203 [Lophiostoma macrostomum CBS 122681]